MNLTLHRVLSGLLCMALLASSNLALAQAGPYKPGKEQQRLMDEAYKASKKDKYKEAERLYRAALALGNFNLVQLSLGRMLQKQGQCFEAAEAYRAARQAPAIAVPSVEDINASLDKFTTQLEGVCPARLVVTCDPPEKVRLTLQDSPMLCGETIERPAGTYLLKGQRKDHPEQVWSQEVTLRSTMVETVFVEIAAPVVVKEDPAPVILTPKPASSGPLGTIGWVMAGTGATFFLAGTAGALLNSNNNDEIAELAREDVIDPVRAGDLLDNGTSFELLQFVGFGLGTALLAGGVALLLIDDAPEPSPSLGNTTQHQVRPMIGPSTVGASWELRY